MLRTSFTLLAAALTAPVALAAPCAEPYDIDALLGDLIAAETVMREGDDEGTTSHSRYLRQRIPCLNEVLPPMILARAYRVIGVGLYVGGDLREAGEWFATSIEIDPTFEFGIEDLPADHPVRSVYMEAHRLGVEPAERLEGRAFVEGTHFLDGRRIQHPQASPVQPHLYQHEKDGVRTWLIEGNAFPDEVLEAPQEAVADAGRSRDRQGRRAREGETTTVTDDGFRMVEGQRHPLKTPVLGGGIAVVLGAGGVYYWSSMARNNFNNGQTVEELDRFRATTNRLVVASGVVLAAGAGTFTMGILLDGGGPTPGVTIRF